MAKAENGNTVQVHYTGKLEDGTVFDSSEGQDPLAFTLGEGQVIQGFEEAVRGLESGSSTTTKIEPEQGYGPHRDDLVIVVSRDQIGGQVQPETGQQLQLRLEDGRQVPVTVTEVMDETITIDANHPLAGKTLIFDIELVDVE